MQELIKLQVFTDQIGQRVASRPNCSRGEVKSRQQGSSPDDDSLSLIQFAVTFWQPKGEGWGVKVNVVCNQNRTIKKIAAIAAMDLK